jgi:L-2-hydroxycarboxylate dehydrogenase (NAD+)
MGVPILPTEPTITFDRLKSFIQEALIKLGLPDSDAATVATLMAQADLQGSDGHGVTRLPQYARRIRAGGFNVRPNIHLVHDHISTAVLNGDNGMGHLVMKRAAEIAIEKARVSGIGWVNSQFSNHAGPASLYATMPLAHDMVGLYFAVGNANHLPPWGGLDMLLSTNPIAAAIPASDEQPIVLDMATTVAAYGKVKSKALRGETMPVGWMIDREGKPLTDPKRADEGMLLPLGGMEAGYKGYGLAMIIGLLAGRDRFQS